MFFEKSDPGGVKDLMSTEVEDDRGRIALSHAAEKGQDAVVESLLEKNANSIKYED